MKFSKLITLILFLSLVSCAKDKVPTFKTIDEDCQDFPQNTGPTLTPSNIYFDKVSLPCFNPNNNDEFLYQFIDPITKKVKLIKYIISSQTKTTLIENNIEILSQPKWNKNGWIVFDSKDDFGIWMIKENGDSLINITNNNFNFYPCIDANGENILFQSSEDRGNPYFLLQYNINSKLTDTLQENYTSFNHFSINNTLLSKIYIGQNQYLATSFQNNVNFTPLYNLGNASLEGLTWHPNNNKFYFTDYVAGGLKEYNVLTNNCTTLIGHCDTKHYTNISCSADGKKIVAQRIDSEYQYDENGNFTSNILHRFSICLIDLETLIETKINLD